jgi:hypothetical protein
MMGEDCLCRSFLLGSFQGLRLVVTNGALHFGREELFQFGQVKTYLNSPLARFASPLVGEGCQTSCNINSLSEKIFLAVLSYLDFETYRNHRFMWVCEMYQIMRAEGLVVVA